MSAPDLDHLYPILREWALAGRPQYYSDLSAAYHERTGEWFEPHGSWDIPLGALNNRLAAAGAPPLSALVMLRETSEPGGGFWGSAPNVPQRPRSETARAVAWSRMVTAVIEYPWPERLPH